MKLDNSPGPVFGEIKIRLANRYAIVDDAKGEILLNLMEEIHCKIELYLEALDIGSDEFTAWVES